LRAVVGHGRLIGDWSGGGIGRRRTAKLSADVKQFGKFEVPGRCSFEGRHTACDLSAEISKASRFGTKGASGAMTNAMTNALVLVAPDIRERQAAPARTRAGADFIAHLIATAKRMPQTRERRRAEPAEAAAAYETLGQRPSEAGRTLSKSL
jgi:hypothetical protein